MGHFTFETTPSSSCIQGNEDQPRVYVAPFGPQVGELALNNSSCVIDFSVGVCPVGMMIEIPIDFLF